LGTVLWLSQVSLAAVPTPLSKIGSRSFSMLLTRPNSGLSQAATITAALTVIAVVGSMAKSSIAVCQQHAEAEAAAAPTLELELVMLPTMSHWSEACSQAT